MESPKWKKAERPPIVDRFVEVLSRVREVLEERVVQEQDRVNKLREQRDGHG